jgi:ligand-binding sensor domain-containing protein
MTRRFLACAGTAGLLCLVGADPAPAAAARPPLRPPRAETPAWYRFGSWRQAEGLPQDTIFDILQSRDGYLWLGTRGGLVRFDGVRFTTFHDGDPDRLRDNEVWSLAEAADGSIWASTYGGGVTRFQDGRFTVYTQEQGLINDYVAVVLGDRDGSVWIGTDRGLSRFKDGAFTNYKIAEGAVSPAVRGLHLDDDGTLWIGTNHGGIHRLQDGKVEPVPLTGARPANEVRWFWRDAQQTLWIGTYDGLLRLEGERLIGYTPADGLSSERIRKLADDGHGGVWIVSDRGLDRMTWDGRAPHFTQVLASVDAGGLCFDREGSLWVGSLLEGLTRLREGVVTTYLPSDGLADYYVGSVIEDRGGRVWIGTRRGLNSLYDGRIVTHDDIPKKDVLTLVEDHEGRIWVGMEVGLFRSKGRATCPGCRPVFEPVVNPQIERQNVRALFEDRDHAMWAGLHQQGLVRYAGNEVRTYTTADGLANNAVRAMAQDRAGALWIGTRGGGLSRLQDGRFQTFTKKDGLAGDGVQVLHIDADDTLWIATRQGISRYKDGRFSKLTVNQGLYANYSYALLEDGQGYMWMESARGVFRVSKKELDDVAEGRSPRVQSEAFSVEHGFLCTVGVAGTSPAAFRGHDGLLWFGTSDGLSVVDPQRLQPNRLAPPIHIETVTVDGKPFEAQGRIEAAPGRGEVSIQYAGLSLLAPEKMQFKYRLEGYDHDWMDAGPRRVAYYTNIPPGRYHFRVIGSNNDGVWNETGAAVDLTLAPHFYQTRWFVVLGVAAIALVGAGSQMWRLRRLKASERELSRRVEESLSQIKTLRGLLPVCASCKKIRDDKGYWNQMETYIQANSEADFSHSVCPECIQKLYPDYAASEGSRRP